MWYPQNETPSWINKRMQKQLMTIGYLATLHLDGASNPPPSLSYESSSH